MIQHKIEIPKSLQKSVNKIKKLYKGMTRTHKQLVKEHTKLVKDLDLYHKDIVNQSIGRQDNH
jgi:hypothetical protein